MRILLVDGTSVVIRYAAAMLPKVGLQQPDHPEVLNRQGEVLTAVERAIRECAMTAAGTPNVIVALDSAESWRKQEYPDYKANRRHATTTWVNRLAQYCRARGIYTVRALGFEADDVIAACVARATKRGHMTAVLSGDGDLLQLASLSCEVFQFGNRRKGEARFVKRPMAWIRDKYGLANAGQFRGYKALLGDPTDKLPGVKGIGPVKAAELMRRHGTIENVLGSGDLRVEEVPIASLMLRLVTLREDAPLDEIDPHKLQLPALEAAR